MCFISILCKLLNHFRFSVIALHASHSVSYKVRRDYRSQMAVSNSFINFLWCLDVIVIIICRLGKGHSWTLTEFFNYVFLTITLFVEKGKGNIYVTTNGHADHDRERPSSQMAICDIKMMIMTSWNCHFRRHSIITAALGKLRELKERERKKVRKDLKPGNTKSLWSAVAMAKYTNQALALQRWQVWLEKTCKTKNWNVPYKFRLYLIFIG